MVLEDFENFLVECMMLLHRCTFLQTALLNFGNRRRSEADPKATKSSNGSRREKQIHILSGLLQK